LGWDIAKNPWIDATKLRQAGGIFLQKIEEGTDFPKAVYAQYPQLKRLGIYSLPYVRPAAHSKPIAILVGILSTT
jgi:hypothetical protein